MQYFHMNVTRLPKDREIDLIASLMDSKLFYHSPRQRFANPPSFLTLERFSLKVVRR